jgi:prepilin-type N-terminal cleavage/methylation domain-containing protein
MNSQRGFTLIELLVVISIIGLLTSLLLVRVRASQMQAYDSAIQQTFDSLRTRAGIDFHENGNFDAVCNDATGILNSSGDYGRINANVKSNNGGVDVKCYESPDKKKFAAWTPLRAEPGTFWCVDWRYAFKKLTAEPPSGSFECP